MRPLRLLVGLALLLFLPGVVLTLLGLAGRLVHLTALFVPATTVFVGGVLLDQFVLRRTGWFETFEHEFTHAAVALLCLRRVSSFVVTRRQGGYVQHTSGFGGVLADDLIGWLRMFCPRLPPSRSFSARSSRLGFAFSTRRGLASRSGITPGAPCGRQDSRGAAGSSRARGTVR